MAPEHEGLRDWHRLFGLLLTDFFTNSPFTVNVEPDLSVQQQRLDVVIVRRGDGEFSDRLPDGFDPLAPHNLITFKSHREALDGWAPKELASHDVAYRKLVSPSPSELLSDDHFRLYAVCARLPHNLFGEVQWQKQQAGVYDCRWGLDTIRIIIAGELPQEPQNAPLHLFSASPGLLAFGRGTYRQRSPNTSALLAQLCEVLRKEGFGMPFTMEDFQHQYAKENFARLTPQEKREALERLSPEERRDFLGSLPPEERLAGLPPEARVDGLSPEERLAGLPPEARLAGLSPEERQQLLDQLLAAQPAQPPKRRRKK
jgi:hypothetical protein